MKNDPDEARLPPSPCKCGQREIPQGAGGVSWYWQLHRRDVCTLELPNERCECGLLRSEHINGHATAPPPAILLAASAADAEVLREWQKYEPEANPFLACLARARIVDASTHVCLPRAEVEALLRDLECVPYRFGISLDSVANAIRALLSRETGKGEG